MSGRGAGFVHQKPSKKRRESLAREALQVTKRKELQRLVHVHAQLQTCVYYYNCDRSEELVVKSNTKRRDTSILCSEKANSQSDLPKHKRFGRLILGT